MDRAWSSGGNELIVLNSVFGTSRGTQENIEWGEGHDAVSAQIAPRMHSRCARLPSGVKKDSPSPAEGTPQGRANLAL